MSSYGVPVYYRDINLYNASLSPSTIHVKNTGLADFFKKYLLQDAMSVFEWEMPDFWDRSYFLYVLYLRGYIGIMDTAEFGVIPQHGTLGGRTIFYGPRYLLVANPIMQQSFRLIIGRDVTLLRLQPDYTGVFDLVDFYGDLMALAAETCGVNLVNSKLSFVFAAKSKAMAESFKELYDQVAEGNPAVFADSKLFDADGKLMMDMFNQDVRQNFLGKELMDFLLSVRCMFLTQIGIPNANILKQSGVSSREVQANDFETRAKCELWLDELQKGCKLAREMFPQMGALSVDWRKDLKEVFDNARSDAVNPGSLQV